MSDIQIEMASLNSWPAFKQVDDNGWISRFADGYTKRSNSVTILRPGTVSVENKIIHYERLYKTKGQPCIFRLLSFNDNTEIEFILNSRNYTKGDHSLVLSQELKNNEFQSLYFDSMVVDEWMKHYCKLSDKKLKSHSTHIKMINNIKGKCLLAVLRKNQNIVSCGLGIISDVFFGIFDIVTAPQYRNKGYGYELIHGMLNWSIKNHASVAYVQVLAENTPAIRLYKKLGFEHSYEYHYKIKNCPISELSRNWRKANRLCRANL